MRSHIKNARIRWQCIREVRYQPSPPRKQPLWKLVSACKEKCSSISSAQARPGPFSACNLCSFSNRKFDLRPKWKLRVTTIYVRKYGLGFSPFPRISQRRVVTWPSLTAAASSEFPRDTHHRTYVLCVHARGTLFYSRGPSFSALWSTMLSFVLKIRRDTTP